MIPKVIHYCWFGGNPLPESAVKCIDSWKRNCSDYQIKEWNESNFDIHCCRYVEEAYLAKKYAFVTDYVRLFVLVNEGGVYMDADVEVLKPLDEFLTNRAFSGFERTDSVPTGIMASEKGFPVFRQLLEDYHSRSFVLENGSFDMTTNCITTTEYCVNRGLALDNSFQVIDGLALYPKEYFCPKDYRTGRIELSGNSYTIHHFAGTWQGRLDKIIDGIEKYNCDDKFRYSLSRCISLPFRVVRKIRTGGFKTAVKTAKAHLGSDKDIG